MSAARDPLNDSDTKIAKLAGNKQIKETVQAILAEREKLDEKNEEVKELRGSVRSLYNAAKCKGIDTKALRKVVEMMRGKKETDELKNTVNAYLDALGEQPLFAQN